MSGALIARRVSGRVTQSLLGYLAYFFFSLYAVAVAIFLLPSPWGTHEREKKKWNEGNFCVFDNLLFCKHWNVFFFVCSRCLNRTMKVDLHTETTVRMLLISPSLSCSFSLVVVVTLLHPHGLSTRCRRTCRCVLFLRSCRGTHTSHTHAVQGGGGGRLANIYWNPWQAPT